MTDPIEPTSEFANATIEKQKLFSNKITQKKRRFQQRKNKLKGFTKRGK